ncbi:MAG TPA: hypothetical protein VE954_40105 [Oligoflexus sp.]|uniref:hypothetical protein n=1 Tax=Oligoflexus sp. TaxID=1971216 RepID=UPI002D6EE126|nr:hypothetical protein [Oligoflexus sp.]HYX39346.1 hypothetical protein [Oligoflexus sp.]
MADIISALGLNGVPELFMLSNEDIDQYKGKKAVIAIMASDRTNPEYAKAERYFAELKESDEIMVITEDHAGGPLHERFHCKPSEFNFVLVDKAGNALMRSDHVPTLQAIREQLAIGDRLGSETH